MMQKVVVDLTTRLFECKFVACVDFQIIDNRYESVIVDMPEINHGINSLLLTFSLQD